jgi:hypothetical protein
MMTKPFGGSKVQRDGRDDISVVYIRISVIILHQKISCVTAWIFQHVCIIEVSHEFIHSILSIKPII